MSMAPLIRAGEAAATGRRKRRRSCSSSTSGPTGAPAGTRRKVTSTSAAAAIGFIAAFLSSSSQLPSSASQFFPFVESFQNYPTALQTNNRNHRHYFHDRLNRIIKSASTTGPPLPGSGLLRSNGRRGQKSRSSLASSLPQGHHGRSSASESTTIDIESDMNDHDGNDVNNAVEIDLLKSKLESYAQNLQRVNQKRNNLRDVGDNIKTTDLREIKAARSLLYFLSNHFVDKEFLKGLHVAEKQQYHHLHPDNGNASVVIGLLERCITQAIRRAGEVRDYKLILKLVDASIHFSNQCPILTPRVFGEAIDALSQRTDANVAKIKSVWSKVAFLQPQEGGVDKSEGYFDELKLHPMYLTGPPTAYELNVYLKALTTRGKLTAAIEIFKQHTSPSRSTKHNARGVLRNLTADTGPTSSEATSPIAISVQPDAYTASLLFSMLAESIKPDQRPADDETHESVHDRDATNNFVSKLRWILPRSPCWQWNVAIHIMDVLQNCGEDNCLKAAATTTTAASHQHHYWNNHVFSSLLSLQGKAQDVFGNTCRGHKNGPQLTMAILDEMIQENVQPDVVTCTLAMKSLGEAATIVPRTEDGDTVTRSIHASYGNLAVDFLWKMRSDPRLPNPNTHACTAAISACSRHGDVVTAVQILEEMRSDTFHSATREVERTESCSLMPKPNTWTYNAVLAAFSGTESLRKYDVESGTTYQQHRKDYTEKRQQQLQEALRLLEQMKFDHIQNKLDTFPDTVTYNTILSMGPFSPVRSSVSLEDSLVLSLIDEMKNTGITRDELTFRNSILSSASSSEVLAVIQRCLEERKALTDETMTSIFNTGLAFLSSRRDFASFKMVMSQMQETKVSFNDESVASLVQILSKCGHCSKLESLLVSLGLAPSSSTECRRSSEDLMQLIGLRFTPIFANFEISDARTVYTKAIYACLSSGNFQDAREILSLMRENGHQPSFECLEMFASAYAQSCLVNVPKNIKVSDEERVDGDDEIAHARNRASNAYKIISAMNGRRPSLKVIGTAAKACARTGEWDQARSLLKILHDETIRGKNEGTEWDLQTVHGVQGTHGYILRQCEAQSNVTSALWFASNIQYFGKSMSQEIVELEEGDNHSFPKHRFDHQESILPLTQKFMEATPVPKQSSRWGMKFHDWISVIKTVSKTGYWRIAVTSLQQLRFYVEKTRLTTAITDGDGQQSHILLNQRYNQLVPAFVATVKCLEREGQYAWAMRVVSDWIEWSGRKPRADAVLSAFRVLAAHGLGDEIKELILKCTQDLVHVTHKKESGYEDTLYIGAINALHIHGLYDSADEVYITAVTDSILPFDLSSIDGQFVLDLHGLNVPLAHSAVRVALRKCATALEAVNDNSSNQDLLIITGRGKNSAVSLRPILRPQVQNMLTEEFYPSLNSYSVPGNTGCLAVPWQDVLAWQSYQQEQKGIRMLELASLLKEVSSPKRLGLLIALMKETGGSDKET